MRHRYRTSIALVALALAATVPLAAHARFSSTTAWARVSGPTQPGVQLGLARTADGVLHVIWNRGNSPTSIFETRVSPVGKAIGTSTVATGFDGNLGLALLAMPDKTLRLFAAGGTRPGSPAYGINTFTAPESGRTWSLQSGAYWGGAVAGSSSVIGATLTKDGQPVTAWRGFAGEGIPASAPQPYVADQTASHLATDGASGAVVLSGVTIAGKGGVAVQQILPSRGSSVVLPLPNGQNDWNSSLSGRIGGPGVYVAYADGKSARLYRYGGGSKTLARGQYTSAAVCAGPAGRLWVAWGDRADGLFVTRSNRAVSAFEAVQKLKLPHNTQDGLTFAQCEGSQGPLDLFADVVIGSASGFWRTHVLARFTLRADVTQKKAGAKVTLVARDAGDPVAGASLTIGSRHLKTDASGQATLTLRPGSYRASAKAGGYAPASTRFSVR
jgi:hypothetical protein